MKRSSVFALLLATCTSAFVSSPSAKQPWKLQAALKSPTEFELGVGRAMDTLRNDYPSLLVHNPDFSIYDESIKVVDPVGVKISGLRQYKASFEVIHGILKILYCPSSSVLQSRICYDQAREVVRVSWHADIKNRWSNEHSYLDGISVYDFNAAGNITTHRIQSILFNDRQLTIPNTGLFDLLKTKRAEVVVGVPHSSSQAAEHAGPDFQPTNSFLAMADENKFDWKALETKNKSRQKFGLAPLSPEEFQELQEKVSQMEQTQEQKLSMQEQPVQKKKKPEFLSIFGIPKSCESHYDCTRPEVCCDFGFTQRCCSSGNYVGQAMPVRVIAGHESDSAAGNY